jgi:glucose 1-dehydrogenase
VRLAGKIALVTGSSRGIGRAIAVRLASEGADVVVNYNRDEADGRQVVEEIRASRRRAQLVHADVGLVAQARRLVAEAVAYMGALDILVNNAGTEVRAPLWEVTEEDYDRVVDLNLKGVFRMLTRTMAVELGSLGITVNGVAPGAIETAINRGLMCDPEKLDPLIEQIPLGRIGKAADVAGVAAFLASSDADYVTGSTYFIDGGTDLELRRAVMLRPGGPWYGRGSRQCHAASAARQWTSSSKSSSPSSALSSSGTWKSVPRSWSRRRWRAYRPTPGRDRARS